MSRMKISFDFDGTLTQPKIAALAKKFVDAGAEVWITTSRPEKKYGMPKWNDDLFFAAKKIGVPRERVVMAGDENKHLHLEGFDLHFDDSAITAFLISQNTTGCVGAIVTLPVK